MSEQMSTLQLVRRSIVEADMIAEALRLAPTLTREQLGAEPEPAAEITMAKEVVAVIEKLIRKRNPKMAWLDVHRAMIEMGDTDGYGDFLDAYRAAAFLVGVDYARRSILDKLKGGL